jgi:hypothetical protein
MFILFSIVVVREARRLSRCCQRQWVLGQYSKCFTFTGTPIGVRVTANDTDSGNSIPNGLVTYVMGTGGQDNFVIDETTGIMSLSAKPRLSLDTNPSMYNVTVILFCDVEP